jgi:LmbE family N-acetylglucosaminyl deacetylase
VTAGLRGNAERFAATPLFGGGTPVTAWRSWDRPFPRLRLPECPALVLVAPHPDDETLGFGATAAMLRSRGVEVQVVSVSDGGGAYPILSSLQRSRLEHLRRDELHRATACLGLSRPLCLGLPDGKLAEAENDVVEVLTRLLTDRGPGTWCAATWRGDGHPDHEAVGRAAAAASVRAGAKLLEYPVWMWHWARPGDPDVPCTGWSGQRWTGRRLLVNSWPQRGFGPSWWVAPASSRCFRRSCCSDCWPSGRW